MAAPQHGWMVRSALLDNPEDAWSKGVVVLGWKWMGDLSELTTREAVRQRYAQLDTEGSSAQSISVQAGQLYRFAHQIQAGDYILTYLPNSREILIGLAHDSYRHEPAVLGERWPNVWHVRWKTRVSRDAFSQAARNSLGSTMSVFSVDDHLPEIHRLATGENKPPGDDEASDGIPFYEQVRAQSDELIADLVSNLEPYAFQDLVAAVLRAMGFQAVSTPPGPDRGVDIVAHPDAFGFERPRIKAQVKHRKGAASGPEMRAFVGALYSGDNGLFVSTGGFTKDAQIEAQKSREPVKLLDRDEFIQLLTEHYEGLEAGFQAQVPLRRLWVPAR